MTIRWCLEHEASESAYTVGQCLGYGTERPCNLVVKRLVPEGALVIEKVEGRWKLPFDFGLYGPDGAPVDEQEMFDDIAHALASQVGESE